MACQSLRHNSTSACFSSPLLTPVLATTSFLVKSSFKASYHLENLERIRAKHIRNGEWGEKENLHRYLSDRLPILKHYFEQLIPSSEETKLAEKIKSRYLTQEGFTYRSSLPFKLNLQKTIRIREYFGAPFFGDRDLDFFLENGFIGPKKIESVSRERLQALHLKYNGMLKGTTPDQNRLKILRQEWKNVDVFDLVTNKEIVTKVSSILGPNIKMRFTSMHEVPPHEGSFTSMTNGCISDFFAHSDMNLGTSAIPKVDTEDPFCDKDAVSVWISISGTQPNNAPLFVFPKTHRWDIVTPLTFLDSTRSDEESLNLTCKLLATKGFANQLNANHYLFYRYLLDKQNPSNLMDFTRTELYMAPGDCLFFTTHLLHGSNVNTTDVSRLGMSIRYSKATNEENNENLSVVRNLFSESERALLGLQEEDDRTPIFQVLGSKHHEKSKPINLSALRDILLKKSDRIADKI